VTQLTQLLNPDMLSSRIAAENSRHQQAVKSLTQSEVGQMTAVHCTT
jgi:hypothetical protein